VILPGSPLTLSQIASASVFVCFPSVGDTTWQPIDTQSDCFSVCLCLLSFSRWYYLAAHWHSVRLLQCLSVCYPSVGDTTWQPIDTLSDCFSVCLCLFSFSLLTQFARWEEGQYCNDNTQKFSFWRTWKGLGLGLTLTLTWKDCRRMCQQNKTECVYMCACVCVRVCVCVCRHTDGDISTELWCCWPDNFML